MLSWGVKQNLHVKLFGGFTSERWDFSWERSKSWLLMNFLQKKQVCDGSLLLSPSKEGFGDGMPASGEASGEATGTSNKQCFLMKCQG